MKKKVCIINTGGTIGMKATEKGFAPEPGYMEEKIKELSELQDESMPEYDFIEYDPILDSTNISVQVWNKIGKDIERLYDQYHGFVILHGTDTMAYTASALAFMLDGLDKPVILTGAQIPISMIRSDGRDNIITSVLLASQYQIPEVCIYFGGMLLRGCRSTKTSADMLIAFESPNLEPLAKVGVQIHTNEKLMLPKGSELKLYPFEENQIAVLKIFPGIQIDIFKNIMTENLKGIVIEAFGTGNIPDNDHSMDEILKKAKEYGTLILVCTQCLKGSATIGRYETSQDLINAGAICGYDMTVEAAVTKLYYLFSRGYSMDRICALMEKSLRGELTNMDA